MAASRLAVIWRRPLSLWWGSSGLTIMESRALLWRIMFEFETTTIQGYCSAYRTIRLLKYVIPVSALEILCIPMGWMMYALPYSSRQAIAPS